MASTPAGQDKGKPMPETKTTPETLLESYLRLATDDAAHGAIEDLVARVRELEAAASPAPAPR